MSKRFRRRSGLPSTVLASALLIAVANLAPQPARAATATGQFNVTITIQSNCVVQSATDLAFGSQGVLTANVDAQSTISVQCTDTTPYTVGISAGNGAAATIAARKMTGTAAATVTYSVYRDAARSLVWGTTIGTDTLAGTGNGNPQPITVYGRVPPQVTPAAGGYSDTLTVTVTY
ncbi:Csu type fimbrial protein [Bradyrhizobium hipponense]|uniref:Csu type fimbrial protein n=1 Tax=Bradyrhizobium hipponense TaxID=2605638 RepID=UPI001F2FC767|nr:spore coat U domain-containing protein [Bradyrhizobium hipponense]